jgi:hypothetical protein
MLDNDQMPNVCVLLQDLGSGAIFAQGLVYTETFLSGTDQQATHENEMRSTLKLRGYLFP